MRPLAKRAAQDRAATGRTTPPVRVGIPALRALAAGYAVAWGYLVVLAVAQICFALLSSHDQAAIVRWASTNVHNLTHDPLGCLLASAFISSGGTSAWPLLAALALFGANRALGNLGTAVVVTAGHVVGTLVSEGIVAYRVAHGGLPLVDRYLIDVGPSYVVVAAAAVALLYGGKLARVAATLDFVVLVVLGGIFDGLSRLAVAAVGHTTAIATGVLLGSWWAWRSRRRGATTAAEATAG